MTNLYQAFALTGPWYNLVLTLIVIYLFYQLYKTKVADKRVFMKPWWFLALALGVFIVETVTTIARAQGVMDIPFHVNGYFELAIISLFIYALLLQKEYIKNKEYKTLKSKPKKKRKKRR